MEFFFAMKKLFIRSILFLAFANVSIAQTKVSGVVLDNSKQPIPYANVVFKGSNTGVVSNEDGRFYIESPDNYTEQHHSLLFEQLKHWQKPKIK